MNEKILLRVEGMDCANCAQTITRALNKSGLKDVEVSFTTGEVTFDVVEPEKIDGAVADIHSLGYKVRSRSDADEHPDVDEHDHLAHYDKHLEKRFLVSAVCTAPLLLHMVFPWGLLHNAWFQFALTLPVMFIGWEHFGKSAWKSLRAGFPNMDVLISIGSTSAFLYSIAGMYMYMGQPGAEKYLFFETAASIITLVLLGNLIEQRSVRQTTTAIRELSQLQAQKARRITLEGGNEILEEFPVSEIQRGDILQVNSGDKIPLDGKILSGRGVIDESVITGESIPVIKSTGDQVTGSTILADGNFRMVVENTGNETTLARIIELVKSAQHSKPPIQKLGDKISAIFVPTVVGISLLTFLISYFPAGLSLKDSLMHSIAVLVISCPCAMGLATPTAVMAGLGRAARNGILIKGAHTLETFSSIKTIVFDKTGTLTTGRFRISRINTSEDPQYIRSLIYNLEQYSSHPIAKSLVKELEAFRDTAFAITWKSIEEDKGLGINATDSDNNLFSLGSFQMVKHFHDDHSHNLYLLRNNELIATVDIDDEIREGASQLVSVLLSKGITPVLLSGDLKANCEKVARATGIKEVYYEQLPGQKLEIISRLSRNGNTAMVGDGINDAPALSKANLGISFGNATHTAISSAQVVLLQHQDLMILLRAMEIGRMTYTTIRQNLFWAFFYNVIAIPVAAFGYLSPMVGAFSMAFSDVVVIGNSLRLKIRNIRNR